METYRAEFDSTYLTEKFDAGVNFNNALEGTNGTDEERRDSTLEEQRALRLNGSCMDRGEVSTGQVTCRGTSLNGVICSVIVRVGYAEVGDNNSLHTNDGPKNRDDLHGGV